MQDKDLARLAQRPDLTNLDLQSSEITDAGLAHLADLNSLKRLHLGHTQVTAAGLRHLVGLDNLTDLDLTGSQVVLEDAVEHLKKMTSLRWLDLRMLRGRSIPTYLDAIDELKAALPNVSFHHLGLRPYLLPPESVREAREIVEAGRWWPEKFSASELVHCPKCNREIAASTRICPRCETRQF